MNERNYGNRWLKKYKLEHPSAFVYRIVDSPVGRKPFDAFVLENGSFVAIEFKMVGGRLLDHQKAALEEVKRAGGTAKVIYFGERGKVTEIEI